MDQMIDVVDFLRRAKCKLRRFSGC